MIRHSVTSDYQNDLENIMAQVRGTLASAKQVLVKSAAHKASSDTPQASLHDLERMHERVDSVAGFLEECERQLARVLDELP